MKSNLGLAALLLIATLAIIGLQPAQPVDAGTPTPEVVNNFTGFFVGTEPTFDSPTCGGIVPYFTISTVFSASGTYTYIDSNYNGAETFDMEIDIYEGSFDPANPGTNYVDGFDDGGSFSVTAGTTYILVVVPHDCSDLPTFGDPFFSILGPGSATNTNTMDIYTRTLPSGGDTLASEFCATNVPYVAVGPFTPFASGIFYYRDLSYGLEGAATGYSDMGFELYEGSFDPANPSATFVLSLDDSGSFELSNESSYYFIMVDYDCEDSGDTLAFYLYGSGYGYRNLGLISISSSQAQMVYQSAGGDPIMNGSTELFLPADADGNGFDTYVVTGVSTSADGRTWLSIWLGSTNFGYVPLDSVTVIAGNFE